MKVVAVIIAAVCTVAVAVGVVNKSRASHSASDALTQVTPPEALARLTDTSPEVQGTLPLFHRLNENYIRGSEPAKGGVTALSRLGVKTLVDLRSRYDHTPEVSITATKIGLRYHWLPMSVWDPPSDELANRFVSIVTDEANAPVFVFCADGLNRTGEMSAIYRLVNDDWTVEKALGEIDELGFNPYYWSLRNYVWTYARKFRPSSLPRPARRISVFEK